MSMTKHLINYMYIKYLNRGSCCSPVVVLSLSIREVVSSSPAWAGRVKPKTFKIGNDCSFARSRHSEVRITGLSDITLKTEVQCRSRCGM
jgi:hypothetical protein